MQKTSYNSIYSKGDRRKLIKVSVSDGLVYTGTIDALLDGQDATNMYFNNDIKNSFIIFEFNEKVCVNEITWKQSNTTTHGIWDILVGNDLKNLTKVGQMDRLKDNIYPFENKKKYKYLKLQMVDGSSSSSPWIYQILFGMNPNPEEIKYIIKQKNKYYTVKNNFLELGEETEDYETIKNWIINNGENDLEALTKTNNTKDVQMHRIENDIWETNILIDFSTIKNSIEFIDENDDSKKIRYEVEPYNILTKLRENNEGLFEIICIKGDEQ